MSHRWTVVSFDAGGTLIEPWPSVGQIYAESAAAMGYGPVDAGSLSHQFAGAWRQAQLDGFNYTRGAWAKVVAHSFHGLVPEPASTALFSDVYERFSCAGCWRVFADVRSTLQALRRAGLRLVVSSNWDERLHPLLTELDLAAQFEAIVTSLELGFCKPDARFFRAVAERLGVPAEQILHIGDGEREDVGGPRAAGWSSLWLRRNVVGKVAENQLQTLSEAIPRILEGRN